MAKVTGVGGVFFKAKNPEALRKWYVERLGIDAQKWGAMFPWTDVGGYTVWSPFAADTKYFEPSTKDFMINLRVDDLDALLAALRSADLLEKKSRDAADPLAPLSKREREVFELAARGFSNEQMAAEMSISVKTIETHRARINRKLHIHSPGALVRFAAQHGLLPSAAE